MGASPSRPQAVREPVNRIHTERLPLDAAAARVIESFRSTGPLQSLHHGRCLLDEAQRAVYHPLRLAPAAVVPAVVPVEDDARGAVTVHVVRAPWADPEGDALLPGIVYVHGAYADFATHERLARTLADRTGAAIIVVDYDRAPDAPWPVAERQVVGVVTWLATCGDRVGVDGTRLALVGDGLGAHVATSAALAIAADPEVAPHMRAQVLVCPILDAPRNTAPVNRGNDKDDDGDNKFCLPWTTRDAMAYAWDAYAPDLARSPLAAKGSHMRLLPPTLVVTADRDVASAHGHAYADALLRAGAPVQTASYGDVPHDFWVLDALADTPSAAGATDLVTDFIAQAFAR
ncbi:Esterase/lipase [Pandoravirus macleodensis]|uniref:Esterase/lipase n=1 Tax=Pandoravirus macleodensis TaxID=2107707 RepID=A0A2U7UGG0_9VIRU|nr:Esterase/lipase [Pandoravirus macleodensis]AVK77593.1 Esterase/lipase [Pandoravirus macleodensis]